MELSELTAYAQEKYGIEEQHKWADFSNFSVLCHPETGKWLALLMRQWDSESGSQIERCDIKCGSSVLDKLEKPYLSVPVRMSRKNWVSIAFDSRTESEVVYQLFDLAFETGKKDRFTIVLNQKNPARKQAYNETSLPFASSYTQSNFVHSRKTRDTRSSLQDEIIPEKILEMIRLYEYGNGLPYNAEKNFYRQGKFMEDYEDDVPWRGYFQKYFATYHDLNIPQLRGYFTWRKEVRRGKYHPVPSSLAYIYIYELLSGIGTSSPEDALNKIELFTRGYVDSGIKDERMKRNIQRWCFEYAIIHGLPQESVYRYADKQVLERDYAVLVVKVPEEYTDEEVFNALCIVSGKKLDESHLVKSQGDAAKFLFAQVWRYLRQHYKDDKKNIFTVCFGRQNSRRWFPLANAIHWEEIPSEDRDYILSPVRSYHLRNGVWKEKAYDQLYFDKAKLRAIIHETDRLLRRYFKTGHYTKAKSEESWVTPYVETVLEAERRAQIEAAKPKIEINFSDLEKIRSDAATTRESLLIEDEIREDVQETVDSIERPEITADETEESVENVEGLDSIHTQILRAVMAGQSVESIIATEYLMPSVVTDTINEALFDEIGDNVLECDGNHITLIDDYKEDIAEILESVE